MTPSPKTLPYFDLILEGRTQGDPAAEALSRYVHWGYWEDPARAGGAEGLQAAMDRLNALVLDAAELADGQSLLDAGCGFGATLGSVDAARTGMKLTGLNIDPRQLAVAREKVKPRSGNTLEFVEGDACALPFPDASFDRVTAVECIFHFPSRLAFIKEAARVLKPGGVLSLSDFVPEDPNAPPSWLGKWLGAQVEKGYGHLGDGWPEGDYAKMAAKAGLTVASDRDITANTLPTYPILLGLLAGSSGPKVRALRWGTRLLDWSSRLGWVRYKVVSFLKPHSK
ncbi:class I SAM-dependent methyltransferase [bacterium]|nr:MAG: class I SAM-dependent methyltransferase [bacterium]